MHLILLLACIAALILSPNPVGFFIAAIAGFVAGSGAVLVKRKRL